MAKRLNPKSRREGLYLDTAQWEEAVQDLLRLQPQNVSKLIKDEAKLLVRDCIKLTPPTTGGKGVMSESLKRQEQAGQEAILGDLKKVIKDVTELRIYKNPKVKKWIDRAFKNHDWQLVLDIVGGGEGAGMQVPDNFHEKYRNKNGRVRSGGRFFIKDTKAKSKLMSYASKVFKRIGKAKAGWIPAARKLKLAKRHWIKYIARHAGKGNVVMSLNKTPNPFVFVANLEAHAQKHNKSGKIMAVALKIRTQVIRDKVKKLMELQAKAFNNKKDFHYNPLKDQR